MILVVNNVCTRLSLELRTTIALQHMRKLSLRFILSFHGCSLPNSLLAELFEFPYLLRQMSSLSSCCHTSMPCSPRPAQFPREDCQHYSSGPVSTVVLDTAGQPGQVQQAGGHFRSGRRTV